MEPLQTSSDWNLVPLGELGEYINGKVFKQGDWDVNGLPIIRIQNLTNPDNPFNYYSRPVEDKYRVSNGDLLISWSATLGVYIWDRGEAILNQHIFRAAVNTQKVEKQFLRYAIQNALSGLERRTQGTTMRHVTKEVFESFKIPVPRSLDTQRRVVARIEGLLAEVREMRTLQAEIENNTGRLMESALAHHFQEISAKYPNVSLSQFSPFITSGPRNWGRYAVNDPIGPMFIRVGNVKFATLDLSDMQYLSLPDDIGEDRAMVRSGDVLLTITGTIGNSAVVPENFPSAYINQHTAIIRVNSSEIYPRYLMWFFLSSKGRGQTSLQAYGQSRPGLNLTQLRDLQLPMPSYAQQVAVANLLDNIYAEIAGMQNDYKSTSEGINSLEKSILAQAFRGEL